MVFPYFNMEFNTRFPYSEIVLFAQFPQLPRYFRKLKMGFPVFEMEVKSKMC